MITIQDAVKKAVDEIEPEVLVLRYKNKLIELGKTKIICLEPDPINLGIYRLAVHDTLNELLDIYSKHNIPQDSWHKDIKRKSTELIP